MSVERLERVIQRLRKRYPGRHSILNTELARAIMMECGTTPITITNNRKALIKIGLIKTQGKRRVRLTDVDITGDYP